MRKTARYVAALLPVILAVSGARADLGVVPDSVFVSAVKIGTSFSDTVVISDAGAGTFTADSVKTLSAVTQWTDSSLNALPHNVTGSDLRVRVRFTPTNTSAIEDTLFIYYDSSGTDKTFKVPLQGQGGLGDVEASDSSFAFGTVNVLSQAQDTVFIHNVGTASLVVQFSMKSGDTTFKSNVTNASIAPGDSQLVQLTFKPILPGFYDDSLRVATDAAGNETLYVALTGTGNGARFSADPPDSLPFGSVNVGVFKLDTIRITNTGNQNLSITSTSGPGGEFSTVLAPGLPATLIPGEDTIWVIRYMPVDSGGDVDTIQFSTNAPGQSTVNYRVSGRGVAPDINAAPSSLNFGQVTILDADTLQVDLQNVGNGNLSIDSVRMRFGLPPYSVVQNVFDGTPVSPGASVPYRVRFAPTLPDSTFRDTIIVYSDDPNEAIYKVPVVGQSVVAALRLTKTTVAFDTVLIGNSRAESLYVVNDGTGVLMFDTDTLTNVQYTVVPNSGNVFAGDSLKVRITFAPTVIGNADAIWRLNTNVPSLPTADVNFTGYGSSRLVVPAALNFGSVTVGQAATLSLPVRNRGTTSADTLRIDTIRVPAGEYTITDLPAFPYVLAPGASDTFTVRFSPLSAAVIPGDVTFEIIAPAADLDSVKVLLTGTGVASTKTVVRFINYPNPFVPESTTTVLLGLGRPATVTITIYDLSGQLLAELVKSQSYGIGEHELIWDGRRYDNAYVAYGVYICEVVATPSSGGEEEREYRKLACGRP